jgi:hypothetical protein
MRRCRPAGRTPARAAMRLPRLLLCTLLAAGLLSGCRWVGTGDGKVIDFVSKEPIPLAAVELTCTVPRHWHGSDEKKLRTESAADGSYHFDTSGLHDCDFFFARAFKAGYGLDHMTDTLTNPGPETSRRIPKIVYLIKESDQPMVLLERLSDYMPAAPLVAGSNAPGLFYDFYMKFVASKRIATTPQMEAWVREHYCARLKTAWGLLSDRQRAGLNYDDRSKADWSPISLRPDAYEREVRPYCGG